MILEKDDGERRTFRGWPAHPEPGETFVLKVDPKNGGSSRLVFGTEDFPPGGTIPTHRHFGADEILFLETGTARVQVGDSLKVVHGGATVFIPDDTWVSVANIGPDVIKFAFIFSAPGFEQFMRAVSVRAGDKNVPIPAAEEDAIEKEYTHMVIYK